MHLNLHNFLQILIKPYIIYTFLEIIFLYVSPPQCLNIRDIIILITENSDLNFKQLSYVLLS